jgi:hypothetical protein
VLPQARVQKLWCTDKWSALLDFPQIGQPVSLEGGLTLAQAVERGLMGHLAAVTTVAETAGKEFAIEQVGCPDYGCAHPTGSRALQS